MKRYIGFKTIEAEPMTIGEFYASRDREIPGNADPQHPGYKVTYPDGYVSWSPVDVFDQAYKEILPEERQLNKCVFPSTERTIGVAPDSDYNGAHYYQFRNSVGFNNGKADYVDSYQSIQFVQKNLDGSMTPGVQSEQLLIALIDRHKKLNEKFSSREGALAITKMEEALHWLRARVEERIDRGVMGDLKK
jgi:hypothetical protein